MPQKTLEPNPLHLASAEAEEKKQQAIRAVMGRDAVDYPTAAKTVDAEGVDAVLAKREAGNVAQHEAVTAENAMRAKLIHDPAEIVNHIVDLYKRMGVLESPKPAVQGSASAWGSPTPGNSWGQ
jgi:hypothetical protein